MKRNKRKTSDNDSDSDDDDSAAGSATPSPEQMVPRSNAAGNMSSYLIESINRAIGGGHWGDVCFVVKNREGRPSWTTVYADSQTLNAHGGENLVGWIAEHSVASLTEAIEVLFPRRSTPAEVTTQLISTTQEGTASAAQADAALDKKLRYIPILKIAATTLHAVILFLTTGHIEFVPSLDVKGQTGQTIGYVASEADHFEDASQELAPGAMISSATGVAKAEATPFQEQQVPFDGSNVASAKSVYQAARLFGLGGLQELAGDVIRRSITPLNIIDELFSPFTLHHSEVANELVEFARRHWNEIRPRDRIRMVQKLRESRYPHHAAKLFGRIISKTEITYSE